MIDRTTLRRRNEEAESYYQPTEATPRGSSPTWKAPPRARPWDNLLLGLCCVLSMGVVIMLWLAVSTVLTSSSSVSSPPSDAARAAILSRLERPSMPSPQSLREKARAEELDAARERADADVAAARELAGDPEFGRATLGHFPPGSQMGPLRRWYLSREEDGGGEDWGVVCRVASVPGHDVPAATWSWIRMRNARLFPVGRAPVLGIEGALIPHTMHDPEGEEEIPVWDHRVLEERMAMTVHQDDVGVYTAFPETTEDSLFSSCLGDVASTLRLTTYFAAHTVVNPFTDRHVVAGRMLIEMARGYNGSYAVENVRVASLPKQLEVPTVYLPETCVYALVGRHKDIFVSNPFHTMEAFRSLLSFFRDLAGVNPSCVTVLVSAANDVMGEGSWGPDDEWVSFVQVAFEDVFPSLAWDEHHVLLSGTPSSSMSSSAEWTWLDNAREANVVVPELYLFQIPVTVMDASQTDVVVPPVVPTLALARGGAQTPLLVYDPPQADLPEVATIRADRVAFARYVDVIRGCGPEYQEFVEWLACVSTGPAGSCGVRERAPSRQGGHVRIGVELRRSESRRRVSNADAVMAAIVEATASLPVSVEIVELDMRALSLCDQVRMFDPSSPSGLDVGVFAHGAAMWTSWFAVPGSGSLQLNTRGASLSKGPVWNANDQNRPDREALYRSIYWRAYPGLASAAGGTGFTLPWPDPGSPAYPTSLDSMQSSSVEKWLEWTRDHVHTYKNPFLAVNYPLWVSFDPPLVSQALLATLGHLGLVV